jgi:hypothetical protein
MEDEHTMAEIAKVLEAIEEKIGGYTERGGGWRAKCPAHLGDSNDSLAIDIGEDGRILFCCHNECSNEDILEALELEWSDAFSKNGQAQDSPRSRTKKGPEKIFGIEEIYERAGEDEIYPFRDEDGTLIYIQIHKGAYYRVVGYDDDGDPQFKIGLAGTEKVLYGRTLLQEAIKNDEPAIHTEGCKDAQTVAERLDMAGVTSGGTTSWESRFAHEYEDLSELWITPDNEDKGRDYAHEVAQDLGGIVPAIKVIELPGLGEGEDITDWLDNGHTKEEFFEIARSTPPLGDIKPWPEKPTPLEIKLPTVEPLDPELLPDSLKGWVSNVAEQMDNAPPDYVAISAIVEAGALLGRRVGIRPKQQADWTVFPNLWGILVGPPAALKSPSMQAALKPAHKLGARADEAYDEAMRQHKYDLMVSGAQKDALEKSLKETAKKIASGEAARDAMDKIREELEKLEEPEKPAHRRYYTNDTTVEELGEVLADNPNGILLYRDELMGWLRTLDKPDRGSDRAFFIEGWSGDIEHLLDRVSRGYKRIPVCLSILGGLQPGPLIKYVEEAMNDTGEKADGLLQRFQLLTWPDFYPRPRSDIPPDRGARDLAYGVYEKLAFLDPDEFKATKEYDDPPHVRFSPEAQEIFNEWYDTYETPYLSDETPPALQSHMSKYRSLLPSLALIFEAMSFATGCSEGGSVGMESTLRAAGWCSYLESHASRAYSPLVLSPEKRATTLLSKIQIGQIKNGAKMRDIRRKDIPYLRSVEDIKQAARVLEDLGWVRLVEVKAPGQGRPTVKVLVHPDERD